MNNIENLTTRPAFINTLEPGNLFIMNDSDTMYVCESRTSEPGATRVVYRPVGETTVSSFTRVGLTTCQIVED